MMHWPRPAVTGWELLAERMRKLRSTFVTRSIAWGNTAPDAVPFNSAKFGNMDYPPIDWTNQRKSYVDPVTGVRFWRVTAPGMMSVSALSLAAANTGILGIPLDASGTGQWAGLANIGSNGASYSVGSGGPSDKAFIPLANFNCPAGTTFAGWYPKCTVDDLSFDVYCGNAGVSGITVTLQLSMDGGQTVVGTPVTTPACPVGAPSKLGTYPQLAVNPPFLSWGFTPQHHLVVPPSGTVSVAGQAVTLQNASGTQNYFDTDWATGTPIFINETYYHVASISSSSALTLQENAGTLTGVPYVGANFGVVVTKSNSSSAVSVSMGINYAYATMPSACCNGDTSMMNQASVSVTMTADGSSSLNPPLTGYLTNVVDSAGGEALLLWIPFNSDGSSRAETRLLAMGSKTAASARLNTSGDSLPFGPTGISGYFFDNADGTSAYTIDVNNRVWKLTYSETFTGCAGYIAFHPYPAYGELQSEHRDRRRLFRMDESYAINQRPRHPIPNDKRLPNGSELSRANGWAAACRLRSRMDEQPGGGGFRRRIFFGEHGQRSESHRHHGIVRQRGWRAAEHPQQLE